MHFFHIQVGGNPPPKCCVNAYDYDNLCYEKQEMEIDRILCICNGNLSIINFALRPEQIQRLFKYNCFFFCQDLYIFLGSKAWKFRF